MNGYNTGLARVNIPSSNAHARDDVPLVVDLDGSLVHVDLVSEAIVSHFGRRPLDVISMLSFWMRRRASLKTMHAQDATIEAENLPYYEPVMNVVRNARSAGRKVYLTSANGEPLLRSVAEFIRADGWFASDDADGPGAEAKAERLVQAFGKGGFDYVGNSIADLPVWSACRSGYAVCPAHALREKLAGIATVRVIGESTDGTSALLKLMRIHQWAKNALVFVPVLTSHQFGIVSVVKSVGAFVAFCLASSAVYILNDLVDLYADRKHPTKKLRPLASGRISALVALPVAFLLMLTAAAVAIVVNPYFAMVVGIYVTLTTAYTFALKRKMLVDIIVLAGLYTLRVIAGGAAISVPISEWLLGFSMFIFMSLALIKRYVELASCVDLKLPDPSNRNYRKSDLDIVAGLAAASGFNAVTLFSLYVSSNAVKSLYPHPQLLWLVCPILMYWIARALMMAHRRMMDDDPIIFALKDRNSLLAAVAVVGIVLMAAAPFQIP
jgi:4-hydroxybenzoate polyprenyltransferase/phosphoserine phosphatase